MSSLSLKKIRSLRGNINRSLVKTNSHCWAKSYTVRHFSTRINHSNSSSVSSLNTGNKSNTKNDSSFFKKKESLLKKIESDKSILLQLYVRPDIIFNYGDKCHLYDNLGNRYLDLTAGIAVNALGHHHPAVIEAIKKQVDKVIHLSNLYHNEHAGDFAQRLVQPLLKSSTNRNEGLKVFLCNSGTEANEAAIKFARKWGNTHGESKHTIVSFTNAFHGRSMGALSATPSKKYQSPFIPMLPGFVYAPYNDIVALDQVMTDDVCGVILEPIQGEGGIHVSTQGFMEAVRQKCNKHNALMIVDEIQAGIGRTGKMYAHQWYENVYPDIITVAKPLANGIPSGAVILSDRVAEILKPGDHGTTFGGSPFSSAVGNAVLATIDQPEFLNHVVYVGELFKNELEELASGSPIITEVRGRGLILGIQFRENVDPKMFVDLCRERHLLVVSAGSNTVRFVPPLIITKQEIQEAMKIMEEVVDEMQSLIARGKDL